MWDGFVTYKQDEQRFVCCVCVVWAAATPSRLAAGIAIARAVSE